MNDAALDVPGALNRGIANLRRLGNCEVRGEPQFDAARNQWMVPVRLAVTQTSDFIHDQTDWYIVADKAYPYGSVDVFPAAYGLAVTFPHQERNTRGPVGSPRRNGKLCVDTPFRGERLITLARDPVGDAAERLVWYVLRSVAWLEAAATNTLLASGDPFELPKTPDPSTLDAYSRVVHDESDDTFPAWTGRTGAGPVTFGTLADVPTLLIVDTVSDAEGSTVRTWGGRPLAKLDTESFVGYWWLWPQPVVVLPWEVPGTWGDLRAVGQRLGVDVDTVIRELARKIRGRTGQALLLIGYRIPARVGADPVEVHWETVRLPPLREGGKPPAGFRQNELGWWTRDRHDAFANHSPLSYVETENWSRDRLQARGRLQTLAADANTAIIGAGALGSAVGEALGRSGARQLTIIDGEGLEPGNVARHTATLRHVGNNKAAVVGRRLAEISPHVLVHTVTSRIANTVADLQEQLDPFDAVIDCSASADVIALLAECWWSVPRTFVSLSVGFSARRLFAFSSFGHQFDAAAFDTSMRHWLEIESADWASAGEVLEGAGCWSPLFPARYDDILIAAAVSLKEFERALTIRNSQPELRVFEQQSRDSGFQSFVRVA